MFHLSGQYPHLHAYLPPLAMAPCRFPFPPSDPGSQLCKYLCKQMRANQINQIQCSLTASQRSLLRQTHPVPSRAQSRLNQPGDGNGDGMEVYMYVCLSPPMERTSVRQSEEVGVGDGRHNVAAISLGKLNHKMPLRHTHTQEKALKKN